MDECKIATQANVTLCKSNQICVDTPSGFQCNCLTGYKINVAGDCEGSEESVLFFPQKDFYFYDCLFIIVYLCK